MYVGQRLRRYMSRLRLGPAARAVVRDRLTYLPVEKLVRIERALHEVDMKGVEGDVVEFGVALGGSGIVLARGSRRRRRYFGLDVFGMIPPPTSDKDGVKSKARYEVISAGEADGIRGDTYYGYRDNLLEEVKTSFARHEVPVDEESVHLVPGLFEESWPRLDVDKVALVHVDCDWYDPVRYSLNAVSDRLEVGGIVVIDDYYDYEGCRAGVEEFFAERDDFVFEDGRNPFLRKIAPIRH